MTAPIFANSALVAAPERLVLRGGSWRPRPLWVRYGLYLGGTAPILIDTGYTPQLFENRGAGLRLYAKLLTPRLLPEAQPEAFLARFGLVPDDITTLIVTHFHADHVSGLSLFNRARFLASGRAWSALQNRSSLANLRHGIFARLLPSDFAERLDPIESRPPTTALAAPARDLLGDGSVLSVDLPGHAEGHFGLLFPKLAAPLLYAVDAQWRREALEPDRRPGFPATLIADDRVALARSTDRVRQFAAGGGDVVLCHDPSPTAYDWTKKGAA